jgi:hypothetical protein
VKMRVALIPQAQQAAFKMSCACAPCNGRLPPGRDLKRYSSAAGTRPKEAK